MYMKKELKISETLTSLLCERNMTLRSLSKACDIPLSSLSEWKNNNRNPNAEDLSKVAEVLDTTIHYLLFGFEDPAEPIQKVLKQDLFSGTFEVTIKKVNIKGES